LAIFYEIGQRGVVTAFVEGSDVFLQSLMNRGLINELIVLTVPTMSTTTSPSVKAVEPNLYRLTLVASGQVGDTDMALVHYMVVTHASSGSNMPSDKKK
jgi:riboflavin biosynthesis pyrimidine reductase